MRLAKSSSNHNFPLNFMSHHKLCKVWCRPKPIINDDTFPINRKNIIHFENFREREYGNGNRDIFSGTGTREREHGNGNRNIFLGNGNTGTGTENFFTGTGTGNGNGEKLFPQDSNVKARNMTDIIIWDKISVRKCCFLAFISSQKTIYKWLIFVAEKKV